MSIELGVAISAFVQCAVGWFVAWKVSVAKNEMMAYMEKRYMPREVAAVTFQPRDPRIDDLVRSSVTPPFSRRRLVDEGFHKDVDDGESSERV